MKKRLFNGHLDPLPGPYATAESRSVEPTPAVMNLVRTQVRALLERSPAFRQMHTNERNQIANNLVKIASYSAALIHDDWTQSRKLGQVPVLKQETILEPLARGAGADAPELMEAPHSLLEDLPARPPDVFSSEGNTGSRKRNRDTVLARSAADTSTPADEFSPRAASQVARITEQTLNAIAFPTFVADLIQGTFQAIVNASIQQMEAYGNLLANVAKTVDQFMSDNITDNQARDYLAASYPAHFRVDTSQESPRIRLRDGAEDREKPDFGNAFGLSEDVDLDEDTAEEVLVPAARRRLAQSRHQVLSTMVLMGINRIVITSGRIHAKMGFRIDTTDTGNVQTASQFDFKNETSGSAGGGLTSLFGGASFKTKNTVAYVSSTKKDSSDEINVEADLTGEVDLKFKSDYFPLSRLANPEMIAAIQGNTPNPAANAPNVGTNIEGGGATNTSGGG